MERGSKVVKIIFFVINILQSVFSLIITVSQYLMMAAHFGGGSAYARQQGVHILVVLFLAVCTFLVTRIKHPLTAIIASVLMTPVLFVNFAIIVAIR